jgi:RimJ/RimL family protein N-acetyltransferase
VAVRDSRHDEEADRLSDYRLEPWAEGDHPLLTRLMSDPAMTEHLGGPESPEKIAERHERYVSGAKPGVVEMFKVVDEEGTPVGSVGYWERESHEGQVYETGWMVLPEFQGRGIATVATAQIVELLRRLRKLQYLYAYPSVDNQPSNAICRKLGFELVETEEFEYPKGSGNVMTCNNWRLDLFAGPGRHVAAPASAEP